MLFRKCLRYRAIRKVPNARTVQKRAVLGWFSLVGRGRVSSNIGDIVAIWLVKLLKTNPDFFIRLFIIVPRV